MPIKNFILEKNDALQRVDDDFTFTVAADGRNSSIRNSVGIDIQEIKDTELSFSCDAYIHNIQSYQKHPGTMLQLSKSKDRLILVPISDDNFYRASGSWTIKDNNDPENSIRKKINTFLVNSDVSNISNITVYKLSSHLSDTFFSNNIFLVGDCAQTFFPNGGLGLNTGIEQAYFLAKEITQIMQNPTLSRELSIKRYEETWRQEVLKRQKTSIEIKEKISAKSFPRFTY
ncbi:MAG: hypothetical protein CMH30_02245 [Micavibrio sp.]|nr:hypothetical protein [Micavibrio sp.]|tara:strand:+ start:1003 stop:1692 length:690 start_codon:yes stop_codon:yes gene_type:complete